MRPKLRIELVTARRVVESPERKRRVSVDPSLALRAPKGFCPGDINGTALA
jgi:hypothetical protein